jgi:hypothetical protein
MMKKTLLTLIALLVALCSAVCSAGCVKDGPSPLYTDTLGVVMNSQNPGSPFEKYRAPEYWEDRIEKDNLTIVVDANVFVPEYGQFQTTIVGRDDITQEMADRFRTVLLGNAELYLEQPPAYPYTKAEIQEQIDATLEYIETPEAVGDLLDSAKLRLKSLEDMYKKAPESFEPGPANTQFQDVQHIDGSINYSVPEISGTAKLTDGREAWLRINKKYDYSGCGVYFFAEPFNFQDSSWDTVMVDPPPFIDAGITMAQAREKAIQAVHDMGLDHLDVSSVEEYRIVETGEGNMPTALRPCYKFYLRRSIGDITTNYALPPGIKFPDSGYNATNVPVTETAIILIAKEGIIGFLWSDPSKILGTENETQIGRASCRERV